MAVGKVPEGYDGTAGRAEETAGQPVAAGGWVWTVTGMKQGKRICYVDSKVSMGDSGS